MLDWILLYFIVHTTTEINSLKIKTNFDLSELSATLGGG
jgi:hypothetical protein